MSVSHLYLLSLNFLTCLLFDSQCQLHNNSPAFYAASCIIWNVLTIAIVVGLTHVWLSWQWLWLLLLTVRYQCCVDDVEVSDCYHCNARLSTCIKHFFESHLFWLQIWSRNQKSIAGFPGSNKSFVFWLSLLEQSASSPKESATFICWPLMCVLCSHWDERGKESVVYASLTSMKLLTWVIFLDS